MAAIKPTARFTRRAKISLIAIVSWLLLTLAITLRVAGVVADTSNPTLGSAGVASPQSTAAAAAIGIFMIPAFVVLYRGVLHDPTVQCSECGTEIGKPNRIRTCPSCGVSL